MKLSASQHIPIKDYNYDLPEDKIAKYPLAERDSSKLLVYRNSRPEDKYFSDIADFLPDDGLMIFQQYKSDSGTYAFQKVNRCSNRNILSRSLFSARLQLDFPNHPKMCLVLPSGQSEKVERRCIS